MARETDDLTFTEATANGDDAMVSRAAMKLFDCATTNGQHACRTGFPSNDNSESKKDPLVQEMLAGFSLIAMADESNQFTPDENALVQKNNRKLPGSAASSGWSGLFGFAAGKDGGKAAEITTGNIAPVVHWTNQSFSQTSAAIENAKNPGAKDLTSHGVIAQVEGFWNTSGGRVDHTFADGSKQRIKMYLPGLDKDMQSNVKVMELNGKVYASTYRTSASLPIPTEFWEYDSKRLRWSKLDGAPAHMPREKDGSIKYR